MLAVVDYGMGNLRSVAKAVEHLGGKVLVTDNPKVLAKADKIIFPGVGHFGKAMNQLRRRKLLTVIKKRISEGIPFFGICLGMQLLFSESEESPGVKGLGVIAGRVKRFPPQAGLAVPHMGWNSININKNKRNILFSRIKNKAYFYFAHSYYCVPDEKEVFTAETVYGLSFCSALSKGNIFGIQFHPEKSQKNGLRVLANFLKL